MKDYEVPNEHWRQCYFVCPVCQCCYNRLSSMDARVFCDEDCEKLSEQAGGTNGTPS